MNRCLLGVSLSPLWLSELWSLPLQAGWHPFIVSPPSHSARRLLLLAGRGRGGGVELLSGFSVISRLSSSASPLPVMSAAEWRKRRRDGARFLACVAALLQNETLQLSLVFFLSLALSLGKSYMSQQRHTVTK